MREIVFDTETTGLDPREGHRVLEIACIELVHQIPTKAHFYSLVDPERDVPDEVVRIHGISADKLVGQPVFAEIVDKFLAFIGDSPLIAHNANFDMRFINAELARLKRPPLPMDRVIDTLPMAQRRHPGAPASLDALCKRFGVDNSGRTFHGALLDCELLAEVYIHLLGGRQVDLGLAGFAASADGRRARQERVFREPRVFHASEAELKAHAAFVGTIKDALWNDPAG